MSLRAKRARLRKLGIVAGAVDQLAEDELDSLIAAEMQRRAELFLKFARAARVSTFVQLGVQVLAGDDMVYSIGDHDPYERTNDSRVLGELAGAAATVNFGSVGPQAVIAMPMPMAAAPGSPLTPPAPMQVPFAMRGVAMANGYESGAAIVVFADGTTRNAAVHGSRDVRDACQEAVEFNALARAATAAPSGGDTAERLRKLEELLSAGLLTRSEYDAKRAAIIESI
jgi:hypothetical protein